MFLLNEFQKKSANWGWFLCARFNAKWHDLHNAAIELDSWNQQQSLIHHFNHILSFVFWCVFHKLLLLERLPEVVSSISSNEWRTNSRRAGTHFGAVWESSQDSGAAVGQDMSLEHVPRPAAIILGRNLARVDVVDIPVFIELYSYTCHISRKQNRDRRKPMQGLPVIDISRGRFVIPKA